MGIHNNISTPSYKNHNTLLRMLMIGLLILIILSLCVENASAYGADVSLDGVPSTSYKDESFYVTLNFQNQWIGDSRVIGYLDISFDSIDGTNPTVTIDSKSSDISCSVYKSPGKIWHKDGYQVYAYDPLVSCAKTGWSYAESEWVKIKVTPVVTGTLEYLYRGTMVKTGFTSSYDPPSSSYKDQQGWFAYRSTTSVVLRPPSVAPTLSAPSKDSNGIYTVSWTSVTGSSFYTIEESTDSWFLFNVISKTTTIKSWSRSGKSEDTYYYRVKACNSGGCSKWSDWDSTVVKYPPSSPTLNDLEATSNDGSYSVSWNSVSGASTYTLEESTSNSFTSSSSWSITGKSKSFSNKPDGTYYYRVKACNSEGCSGWSSSENINIQRPPSVAPTLSAPSKDSNGIYTVSWTSVTGSSSYTIEESTDSWFLFNVISKTTTIKSWSRSGKYEDTYYYRVKACNSGGCSEWSDWDSTVVKYPPSNPTMNNPGATSNDGSYSVSWNSVSGTTSYTLEESTSSSFSSIRDSWTITGKSKSISSNPDGTYYYRVKACNSGVCSGWSNVEDIIVNSKGTIVITALDVNGISAGIVNARLSETELWSMVQSKNTDSNGKATFYNLAPTTSTKKYYVSYIPSNPWKYQYLSEPEEIMDIGIGSYIITLLSGQTFSKDIKAAGLRITVKDTNGNSIKGVETKLYLMNTDSTTKQYYLVGSEKMSDISGKLEYNKLRPTTGYWTKYIIEAYKDDQLIGSQTLDSLNAGWNSATIILDVLSVSASADPAWIPSEGISTVTATVTFGGNPISGATVTFSKDGGSLNPLSCTTESDGKCSVIYTAPSISSTIMHYNVVATASKSGYLSSSGSVNIPVHPLPSPSVSTLTTSLSMEVGETRDIYFTITNNGGPTSDPDGYFSLTVSSGLTIISNISTIDADGKLQFNKMNGGDSGCAYSDGSLGECKDELLDVQEEYSSGETNTIKITVKATGGGDQYIKFRTAFLPVGGSNYVRNPKIGYVKDFQGWYVNLISVDVLSSPVLENWEIVPATAKPGDTVKLRYYIYNPNSEEMEVTLGATLRNPSGQTFDNTINDIDVSVKHGRDLYERDFNIPDDADIGLYDAMWGIHKAHMDGAYGYSDWQNDVLEITQPSTSLVVTIQSPQDGFSVSKGSSTTVSAKITDNLGNIVTGASNVKATFSNGDADLTLFDDGSHDDGAAKDGVYANTWTPETIAEGYTTACTITVSANHGVLDPDSSQVTGKIASPTPLSADFSISPSQDVELGEKVTFDASLSKGDIKYYNWFLGDGWDKGLTIKHLYMSTGSYSVTLTVEDNWGNQKSVTKTVNINSKYENAMIKASLVNSVFDENFYSGSVVFAKYVPLEVNVEKYSNNEGLSSIEVGSAIEKNLLSCIKEEMPGQIVGNVAWEIFESIAKDTGKVLGRFNYITNILTIIDVIECNQDYIISKADVTNENGNLIIHIPFEESEKIFNTVSVGPTLVIDPSGEVNEEYYINELSKKILDFNNIQFQESPEQIIYVRKKDIGLTDETINRQKFAYFKIVNPSAMRDKITFFYEPIVQNNVFDVSPKIEVLVKREIKGYLFPSTIQTIPLINVPVYVDGKYLGLTSAGGTFKITEDDLINMEISTTGTHILDAGDGIFYSKGSEQFEFNEGGITYVDISLNKNKLSNIPSYVTVFAKTPSNYPELVNYPHANSIKNFINNMGIFAEFPDKTNLALEDRNNERINSIIMGSDWIIILCPQEDLDKTGSLFYPVQHLRFNADKETKTPLKTGTGWQIIKYDSKHQQTEEIIQHIYYIVYDEEKTEIVETATRELLKILEQDLGVSVFVTASPSSISSKGTTTITATVAFGGNPISGATVTFSKDGGSLNPTSCTTATEGKCSTTYTAPSVSSTIMHYNVVATASKSGYLSSSGSVNIPVHPLPSPSVSTITTSLSMEVGETKEIYFTITNNGGPASDPDGYFSLTVSSGLTITDYIATNDADGKLQFNKKNRGDIGCAYSDNHVGECKDELLDVYEEYSSQETNIIKITIKAISEGDQAINHRTAFLPIGGGDYVREPELGYIKDFQGWFVHNIPVQITTTQSPTLSTITVSPSMVSLLVDDTLTLTAEPTDQFGDPISASVTWTSSDLSVGSIDPNTGVFTAKAAGTTIITATSGSVSGSASVEVRDIEEQPVLTTITVSPSLTEIFVGSTETFVATPQDQFGDPISASVTWTSSNPSVGSIDPNTGVFTANAMGIVIVTATSGSVSGSSSITVSSLNSAPITKEFTVNLNEDASIDIILFATDVDGDSLSYSLVYNPDHGSITLNGNVASYTPDTDYNGADSFTFKANDGTIDSNIATVSIIIYAVNDAPILEIIADTMVTETESVSIQVVASDLDGDSLTFTSSIPMPVTATFDATTNTFTWFTDYDTVKYSDSKTFSGYITVTDSGGLSDTQPVNVIVKNKNRAPILAKIDNIILSEGGYFIITPVVFEPDNDPYNIQYKIIPSGLDGGNGLWHATKAGEYTLNVNVIDSGGLSADQDVTITVKGTPPRLFVVNPLNNTKINEKNITVSGIIFDNDLAKVTLNLNLNGIDNDLTSNIKGGWFEKEIGLSDGKNTLVFQASDGTLSSQPVIRMISLNKAMDNKLPELTIIKPAKENIEFSSLNDKFTIYGKVSDDSGIAPKVNVSIGSINEHIGTSNDGYFSATVTLINGNNEITVTATDAVNNTLKNTSKISVKYTQIIQEDTQKPVLIITYPPNGLYVHTDTLLVTGYARDWSGINSITVNGKNVVHANGVFSTEINLNEGENEILVNATDSSVNNNLITKKRIVNYNKPDDKSGTIKVEKITLAVSQNVLIANSSNVTSITAMATDLEGRPANNSENVTFITITNSGKNRTEIPVTNGKATITVNATEQPQTIIVIAGNDTIDILETAQIVIKPEIKIEKSMKGTTLISGDKRDDNGEFSLLDGGILNIKADSDLISELVNNSQNNGDKTTISVGVGSGALLLISLEKPMLTDSNNLTGKVVSLVLNNNPITTDFTNFNNSVGQVTFDIDVNLNGNTIPDNLEFELSGHNSIDDAISSIGGEDANYANATTIIENIIDKLKNDLNKNADKSHVYEGVVAVIHGKLNGASNDNISEVSITFILNSTWYNSTVDGKKENLKVFEINETTGEITVLEVYEAKFNSEGDKVTIKAKSNGFSSFALMNTNNVPDNEGSVSPLPPSSGGGGGGGGGGTSGEAYENIDNKEKYEKEIYKDITTNYHFKANRVVEDINITGNVNAGLITTMVEVLHNTSTLVNESAPGNVYKNVNIWVGTFGFAVPKNIKEATIKFNVNKTWLDENGIHEVVMYRHTEDEWIQLTTERIGAKNGSIIYYAVTNRFSPYAISGLFSNKSDKGTSPPTSEKTEPTATVTAGKETNIEGGLAALLRWISPTGGKTSDFLLMIVVVLGLALGIGVLKRRKM